MVESAPASASRPPVITWYPPHPTICRRFAGGFREDVERWWDYSWVFHSVNSGKRSITLDLGSD